MSTKNADRDTEAIPEGLQRIIGACYPDDYPERIIRAALAWRDENGEPWLVTRASLTRYTEDGETISGLSLVDEGRLSELESVEAALVDRDRQIARITEEREVYRMAQISTERGYHAEMDRANTAEAQCVALREALRDMLDEVAVSNQDPGPFDGPSRGCVDRARALLATGEQP